MAKNKQHPPSSPAALVSNKRRRLASINNASLSAPAAPSVPTASPSGSFASPAALAAPTVRAVMSALDATTATESKPPSAADADSARDDVRPVDASKDLDGIVLVEAHAAGASKLITVVEIAKRMLESAGRPWWAYTGVKGTMEELKSRGSARSSRRQSVQDHHPNGLLDASTGEDDEEEAFEPPSHGQIESEKKVRSVSSLLVYLAIKPLPSLRAIYGEQCSKV
ncbi:hypothetical protein SLS58_007659 [Diplodia intermedia]|uniref:DNA/RNA-binding protein Alba-like domain-containing protein n=1 Tax=Diplodia intermedia TaxID=856260 RepID=A0ABR3TK55_9PEZI